MLPTSLIQASTCTPVRLQRYQVFLCLLRSAVTILKISRHRSSTAPQHILHTCRVHAWLYNQRIAASDQAGENCSDLFSTVFALWAAVPSRTLAAAHVRLCITAAHVHTASSRMF